MTQPDQDSKGPAVRFPPPLIFLAVTLASLALQWLLPVPMTRYLAFRLAGAGLIVAGMAVIGVAAASFYRANTHIEPWKPTHQIIQDGIFAYSRNPIYLAFCLFQLGVGLWLHNVWTVIATPLSAALVVVIAIRNEERYLERKFGEQYVLYKSKVRRWL